MEEVKSRAKWWNNEVVVPSLRTSLCMLSGPGALPRLRNLTILMRVQSQHPPQDHDHRPCPICSHRGLQEDKNIHSYPR